MARVKNDGSIQFSVLITHDGGNRYSCYNHLIRDGMVFYCHYCDSTEENTIEGPTRKAADKTVEAAFETMLEFN